MLPHHIVSRSIGITPELTCPVRTFRPARQYLLRCAVLCGVGAAACSLIDERFHPTVVNGPSMQPTLKSGQLVWLDRSAYRDDLPARGEVIVFQRKGVACIKRVYRAPREDVYFVRDGDGQYTFFSAPTVRLINRRYPRLFTWAQIRRSRVPDHQVWVLGDNPDCSEDSRSYGPIDLSSVLGRVRIVADVTALRAAEFTPYSYRRRRVDAR
jgi:signal peptidase I